MSAAETRSTIIGCECGWRSRAMTDDELHAIGMANEMFVPGDMYWGVQNHEPKIMVMRFGDEIVVTIHADGRIEINPKYNHDDAARAFWAAVVGLAPVIFEKSV